MSELGCSFFVLLIANKITEMYTYSYIRNVTSLKLKEFWILLDDSILNMSFTKKGGLNFESAIVLSIGVAPSSNDRVSRLLHPIRILK